MHDKVGLVTALPSEGLALFDRKQGARLAGRRVFKGTLPGGTGLLGTISGMGRENASSATRWLVENGCRIIVVAGVAGGLKPGLIPGDLVIPEEIVEDSEGTLRMWTTAARGNGRLSFLLEQAGCGVHRGKLFSSGVPILTPGDKRSLHRRTEALAVDMESAGVAHAAAEAGVPFFVLRAVCDPAERGVPAELSLVLDSNGRVRIPALLGQIVRNPGLIPEMLRLRREFNAALTGLRCGWQALLGRADLLEKPD